LNFFAAFSFWPAFHCDELTVLFVTLGPSVTPPSFVLNCERLFTAPFRALSPTGLLTAILSFLGFAVDRDLTHFLPVAV
jgi:hypothetical protein